MSQTVAITTGIEKVTESLISQVAKEHFKLVRPVLLALKSGNMKEIVKYSDISTPAKKYVQADILLIGKLGIKKS